MALDLICHPLDWPSGHLAVLAMATVPPDVVDSSPAPTLVASPSPACATPSSPATTVAASPVAVEPTVEASPLSCAPAVVDEGPDALLRLLEEPHDEEPDTLLRLLEEPHGPPRKRQASPSFAEAEIVKAKKWRSGFKLASMANHL